MRPENLALLAASLLLSACAPRLYERQRVDIDHRDLDQFEIRYADFEGCLIRQAVPVRWRLRRPAYTLDLALAFGSGPQAPASLELALSGDASLSARFPGLQSPPPATDTGDGHRYRVPLGTDAPDTLQLQVLRGEQVVGSEALRLTPDTCRALSLGQP